MQSLYSNCMIKAKTLIKLLIVGVFKAAYSVTMNIFQKNLFSF